MGQIKNIKLHIVTDIKESTIITTTSIYIMSQFTRLPLKRLLKSLTNTTATVRNMACISTYNKPTSFLSRSSSSSSSTRNFHQIRSNMGTYGGVLTTSSTVQFPRIHFHRCLHTSGDEELVEFLQEEIRVEEGLLPSMPKSIQGYEMHMEGTVVRLTRQEKGEKVIITFDINNNINAPIPLDMDDDADVDAEEGEGEQNLISYPELSVSITKPSGATLMLTCTTHPMDDIDD